MNKQKTPHNYKLWEALTSRCKQGITIECQGRNLATPHTHSWAGEVTRSQGARRSAQGGLEEELKSMESGLAFPLPTVGGPRLDLLQSLPPRTLTLRL